jgi:hypothetical protein
MLQRELTDVRNVRAAQRVRNDIRSIKMFRREMGKDFVVIVRDNRLKTLPGKAKLACRKFDAFLNLRSLASYTVHRKNVCVFEELRVGCAAQIAERLYGQYPGWVERVSEVADAHGPAGDLGVAEEENLDRRIVGELGNLWMQAVFL